MYNCGPDGRKYRKCTEKKQKKQCNPVSYYLSGGLDVAFLHIVKRENQRVALVDSRCFWGAHVVRACDRVSDYSSR